MPFGAFRMGAGPEETNLDEETELHTTPAGGSTATRVTGGIITNQKKTKGALPEKMSEYEKAQKGALKIKGLGSISAGKK